MKFPTYSSLFGILTVALGLATVLDLGNSFLLAAMQISLGLAQVVAHFENRQGAALKTGYTWNLPVGVFCIAVGCFVLAEHFLLKSGSVR